MLTREQLELVGTQLTTFERARLACWCAMFLVFARTAFSMAKRIVFWAEIASVRQQIDAANEAARPFYQPNKRVRTLH